MGISPYQLLDYPWLYKLSQRVLAPGAQLDISRKIQETLSRLPTAGRWLDVGCGPASWLSRWGLKPLGVDISFPYVRRYAREGHRAILASADKLPFPDRQFDAVWSIFLLHHLPEEAARQAVGEMIRVCRPGGTLAVWDIVYPRSAWRRPLAYWIRRLDRGGFARKEKEFTALLPPERLFHVERFTYSLYRLELLICWTRIPLR